VSEGGGMSVNEEGIDGMIHLGKNDFVQVQSKKENNNKLR